jgi:hypothetical protein
VMLARLLRWVGPGAFAKRILFETVIDPLTNAAQPARFEF